MAFFGKLYGDIGPPVSRSGKPVPPRSRLKGFGVISGGAIMDCCHIEVDEAAGLFEPSSMTSLMPLWLAVLIADGDDPSMAFSLAS